MTQLSTFWRRRDSLENNIKCRREKDVELGRGSGHTTCQNSGLQVFRAC
jgi:hypothetical protein